MSVQCAFGCGRECENPNGWPVCKSCYEDGTYTRWLRGQVTDTSLALSHREACYSALVQIAPLSGIGVRKP